MKADTHPKYVACTVTCGCGTSFSTRATVPVMRIEICGSCHPFYTGKQKFVDSAGRVDRFMKRFGKTAAVAAATKSDGD
ncbi:MAG TPA: 50S ribosomal protein L31 [Planctomycetota bacterium]|jgi:large subunit ribosomal protein L31|nr:50S ribosomal protein L31 [Planctomycetota bacterium]